MKNFFVFVLSLVFINCSFAQQLLSVGIKAGYASANMSGDISGKKSVNGPVAGGVINYSFTPLFSLQVEGYYLQKGGGYGVRMGGYNYSDYYRFRYAEFPVLAKFTFGKQRVKFIANAGPYFGYVLGGEHVAEDSSVTTKSDVTNFTEYDKYGVKTTRYDIGFQIGTGMSIEVGQGKLFIEGRFASGFVKWFKFNQWQNALFNNNTPLEHRVVGIYVGYTHPVWFRK